MKGCRVLFKTNSGIAVCGEQRADGNQFFCTRCLQESQPSKEEKTENVLDNIEQFLPMIKGILSSNKKRKE